MERGTTPGRGGRALALACVLPLLGASLSAQTAARGRVTDGETRRPLDGAEILAGAEVLARTDSAGRFLIGGLAPGAYNLVARRIGYRPRLQRVTLHAGDSLTVDFALEPAPQMLPEVGATAEPVSPAMRGFEERRAAGFGSFITADVLRASEHRTLADVIKSRVAGVQFAQVRGQTFAFGTRRGCPMAVWLDGLRIYAPDALSAGAIPRPGGAGGTNPPPDFSRFSVTEFEGIEVYVGQAQTPAQFNLTGSTCGTIVLWTRVR